MAEALFLALGAMKCDWCDEEVEAGEDRRYVVYMDTQGIRQRPRHRECDVRAVVGSLGHQLGLCTCHGGPGVLDDPPHISRRSAARLAALYFNSVGVDRALAKSRGPAT